MAFFIPAVDLEPNDLASIVKNRRALAAKAAEERELREAKERERREVEAKYDAVEKAANKAEQDSTVTNTEAKAAWRANLLGTDRRDRRYWRFFCAPNRLFVEGNWGPEDYQVTAAGPAQPREPPAISTVPTPHLLPSSVAACPPAKRLGYGAASRWYVFDRVDQMDGLAGALVEKGVRESNLKKNLVQSGLLESVKELISMSKSQNEDEEEGAGDDVVVCENGDEPKKSAEE